LNEQLLLADSGHYDRFRPKVASLRAGLVTEAACAGEAGWRIRTVTGHASDATLARYMRDAELWADNPVWAAFGKRRGIRRRECAR